jgi:nucleoside transporter
MEFKLYLSLSVVMFLEYAIWGAWMPVLATRLFGPLKFNGKQTGLIYATLPIACIFAPLLAGQMADKWFNTEWILAVSHAFGAVLLFLAAKQRKFGVLFIVMLLYSVFFAATLPLVNSVLLTKVADGANRGKVFVWAPVAWAIIGYLLSGWRWKFKTGEEGSDCLYLAAILSVAMAAACLFLPKTVPADAGGTPILNAFGMLKENPNFLIFMIISMFAAGMMQFYFLGTAQFMQNMKIPAKNVPAFMALAQAVQAAATFLILGFMLNKFGFKITLITGLCSWLVLYLAYIATKPSWLIVCAQPFHGIAYVLFIIVGQIFTDTVATKEISASMQALVFAATVGVGSLLGTQLAGVVMDKFKKEGEFEWRRIWLVPGCIMLISILALWLFFSNPAAA